MGAARGARIRRAGDARAARDLGADLTIGHQEVGAWVACALMDEGRAVGADIEDWYSEDLLPEARVGRPVELLRRCEAQLVRRGSHVTTTSEALAQALAEAYGGPDAHSRSITPFPWADRADLDDAARDRQDRSLPSLHWVSQTIGPGRGLDTLCEALRGSGTRSRCTCAGAPKRPNCVAA